MRHLRKKGKSNSERGKDLLYRSEFYLIFEKIKQKTPTKIEKYALLLMDFISSRRMT
jgi:hypothetical protein